jgi:hypothetical protein
MHKERTDRHSSLYIDGFFAKTFVFIHYLGKEIAKTGSKFIEEPGGSYKNSYQLASKNPIILLTCVKMQVSILFRRKNAIETYRRTRWII